MLLDLSSAFDSVDHAILLQCLRDEVGITGTALDWLSSYLSARSVKVIIRNSPAASLTYGVPQGSLLGPILFCLCMLPLGSIMRKYNISYHCYADDTQIYISLSSDHSYSDLFNCFENIKCWTGRNILQLNDSKTEIVVFGPPGLPYH